MGQFAWPGFGQNIRVLDWILNRVGNAKLKIIELNSPIGNIPNYDDLNLEGMNLDEETWNYLTALDQTQWQKELSSQQKFFARFEGRLPPSLHEIQVEISQSFFTN